MTDKAILERTCPSCKRNFTADLVVCPEDRTMLLSKRADYDDVLSNSRKAYWHCSLCKTIYEEPFFKRCPKDWNNLEQKTKATSPEKRLSVLEDRYKLETFLGDRKLTHCYQAEDLVTGQKVLIQLLILNLCWDQKTTQRFFKGAKSILDLKHPNIHSIYSTNFTECESENGMPYTISELLEGVMLSHLIKYRKRLAVKDTVLFFTNIAKGLEFAHSKNIVHGNLSLSNIFVMPQDYGSYLTKIFDFGIAERLFREVEWNGPASVTRTASLYGEITGIAPELMLGSTPNAISDIYSLGCSLYETLAGQPPFKRDTDVLTLLAHLNNYPDRFPNHLKVPESLQSIVFKALEKEPENRFQRVEEFTSALLKVNI